MATQISFSEAEYAGKYRITKRDRFLARIEAITPWAELERLIEPYYPGSGGRGRPPVGISRMLRMYIVQQCFGLSDEALEDAVYDSQAIRRFVGIDLSGEAAPDATTVLKFRHRLEAHGLTESLFNTINAHLADKGLMLREGTIVDATLIAAPPSTKNRERRRDPEMHSSRKGKQWHFGMKAHIGVDAHSGLVHTLIGTPGNVADITCGQALLHGEETDAFGDAGYQGIDQRPESLEAAVTWHIAMRRGKRRKLKENGALSPDMAELLEQVKSGIRAKVEHPFHVVKNIFRHRKTRYRGLMKNTAHLFSLFGLANLFLACRWLLSDAHAEVAP
jgi:IS5 family transposase